MLPLLLVLRFALSVWSISHQTPWRFLLGECEDDDVPQDHHLWHDAVSHLLRLEHECGLVPGEASIFNSCSRLLAISWIFGMYWGYSRNVEPKSKLIGIVHINSYHPSWECRHEYILQPWQMLFSECKHSQVTSNHTLKQNCNLPKKAPTFQHCEHSSMFSNDLNLSLRYKIHGISNFSYHHQINYRCTWPALITKSPGE